MTLHWKRLSAYGAAALAVYSVAGFFAVPWIAKRELATFVQARLQRKASISELKFNPFTLRAQASDLRLAEADDSPIASVGSLVVQPQWRSLFTGAWRFAEIQATAPTVHLVIGKDGRFNLAELADAFNRGREPSADSSPPRLVIDRLAVDGGAVVMRDRHAGYSNTFAPVDFDLTDFSTLPGAEDEHVLTAHWRHGGTLRWKGRASMEPLRASGSIEIENASLPELSVYLKSRTRVKAAAGKLSATLPYTVSYVDGKLQARLAGAQLTVEDFAAAREAAKDSFASLTSLQVNGVDADFVARSFKVAEVHASRGKLTIRRDEKGRLDIEDLMTQSAADDPAPPEKKEPVAVELADWDVSVNRVLFDDIALAAVDETVSPSLNAEVASVRVELGLHAAQAGERFDLRLDGGAVTLADVNVSRGGEPPVKLARLGFDGGTMDLAARRAAIGKLFLEGGEARLVRDGKGEINLAGWVPRSSPAPAVDAKAAAPAWTATLADVEVSRFNLALADEQTGISLHAKDAKARIEGLGTDLKRPVKFAADLTLAEGGQLAGQGSIVPATGAARAQVKVAKLALTPLQPLLARYVKLKLADGTFSARGTIATAFGARTGSAPAVRYEGGFDVSSLRLNELDGDLFGAWQNIGAERLTFTAMPGRLDIPELRIVGADAKLVIEQDRSFNATRLLVHAPEAAAQAPAQALPTSEAEPFPVRVRRIRVQDAKLDFTDLSLLPPFSAKIHELNGVVNGLSSSGTARSQVELDGRVDEFGLARIRGELNPFAPKNNTDVNVVFRNVDMVPASPYTMKFAGYRIAAGKISLDLGYKIREGKLEGDNKVVIDQLTLGERVESPDALKIPLQLAIAVLKDADGRIDLGVPVSGDLADPQFSYGAVIWKAIGNVLTKIVTAPFRALGAALGISGDKLEAVTFDPGSGKLLPPEREKLNQVAQILAKRAGLKLSIPSPFSTAADGAAIRTQLVRREVAERAGIKLKEGEQPGPLDIGDRSVRSALRELYAKRFGDEELDKARKAAEDAGPAAPASSPSSQAAGAKRELPLWQRLGKMIQGEPQVADASAFYAHLRERLEREHALPQDALTQLASARAGAVIAALREAGVDAARASAADPHEVEAPAGKPVPLKLELAAR